MMVLIAFFVVQGQMPALLKYISIMLLTFASTLLIYESIIKRTVATRLLFGLKVKANNKHKLLPTVKHRKRKNLCKASGCSW
jgi:hypothetical protein